MQQVRIVSVGTAHPELRISQEEAAAHVAALARDSRRVTALARGTRIASRAIALPAGELAALSGIEERNAVYRRVAPAIALGAAKAALGEAPRDLIGALVTSSCTGYAVPGWGVDLVQQLGMGCETARLPITESGCAGGVVALARAVDYLRVRPDTAALVVAAEVCSLSFHAGGDEGNVTSTLIFGDGAGCALLQSGPGFGLEILDSMSVLLPGTQDRLGFDLTNRGFYPVLSRELAQLLPPATGEAVQKLLGRNGVEQREVGAWLLHPGGAKILAKLEKHLCLDRERTRWSWEAMREHGNTSSAAIFDVLERYLAETRTEEYAVVAAFGPGVSIELLLVRRAC